MKLTLAMALVVAASTAHAADTQSACEGLADLALSKRQIVSAKLVAAGAFQTPEGPFKEVLSQLPGYVDALNAKLLAMPAFCRVQGAARPTADSQINFEVWLPVAENWNGRYYQHGEGGGGGIINYGALASFVRDGSIAAATDDGHVKAKEWSFAWALRHPEKIIDQSYRALQVTTDSAKALAQAYYGKAPRHSYFEGCSGGGGYAMIAAQRFPQEWDGILAGAPSNNALGYFAANAWNSRTWLDPQTRLPPGKLPAVQRAALRSCSPQAHVVDGIPTDPRFCRFDPAVLSCKGAETDDCLTKPQVATLKKIYGGPRNPRTGEPIYPGFPPTGETAWLHVLTSGPKPFPGIPGGEPFNLFSANIFYRNYVFDDPQWDIRTFDFDRDMRFTEEKKLSGESMKSVMNAINPDLSPLRGRGAKMLMYFGWADQALTPLEGISYYENVARTMGGLNETREFFRLFMAPGMAHCYGGAGANAFGQFFTVPALKDDPTHNILKALEAWVETDRPPDRIIAVKYTDDDPKKGVAFTRPLCPHPQSARYKGTGNMTEAENFECKANANPKSGAIY